MDRDQIKIVGNFVGVTLSLWLAACAHQATDRAPAAVKTADPAVTFGLPNRAALKPWRDIASARDGEADLSVFPRVSVDCKDTTLVPTHPQQSLKKYHLFRVADYDHSKLVATDQACTLGSKLKSARGSKLCLRGNIAEDVILSDTYADSCGHRYRGFWEIAFLKTDETMGTLFAKGRTMYPDPKSDFEQQHIMGHTYAVPAQEFMFLTPLREGESEQIDAQIKSAVDTHTFNEKTRLFEVK